MANKDYTFSQVVNGTGYFSQSQDTGKSDGVVTLQKYLRQIGYTINDPEGRFQTDTKEAVENFQYELALTRDGSAGPDTCLRLNRVRLSKYWTTYGKPLDPSTQWGRENILAGNAGDDIDTIARIILAESGYSNLEDQNGVAIVMRNRYDKGGSLYLASESGSRWQKVICKSNAYSTTKVTNEIAPCPRRGYGGFEDDGFVSPGWKHAVDTAIAIFNDRTISATGYVINGTTIASTEKTINSADDKNYLNQQNWDLYKQNADDENADTSVKPLTFSKSKNSNVIYKIK